MNRKERRKAARKATAVQIRSTPELQDLLRTAVSHHQAGRLAQAEVIYRQIVQLKPDHAEALHLMGVLALQVGRQDASVNYIGQALACDPRVPDYHYNFGLALTGQGKPIDAARHFQKAIELKPDYAEAHNNLGNSLKEQGKLEEAAGHYRRALDLRPDYAAAHNNLGTVLHDSGRTDEAVAHYRKAIEMDPGDAETHYNLGNAFRNLGRFGEAVEEYKKTVKLSPRFVDAYVNLASTFKGLGQLDAAAENYKKALEFESGSADIYKDLGNTLKSQGEVSAAIAAYRQALALKPDFVEAQNDLGNACEAIGEYSAAIDAYRQALALKPDYAEGHNNLGIALEGQGKVDEAIDAYRQALALKPDFAEAHNNLGNTLKAQGEFSAAIDAYRQALALNPDYAEGHNNLGIALQGQGKVDEAIAAYRQALALKPDFAHAHSNLLFCSHYRADIEPAELLAEHRRWGEKHTSFLAGAIQPHANDATPDRRLRIGYLSPDFRTHSVAFFIEPLLGAHDRKEFEVVCYTNGVRRDAVTKHLQGLADKWRDIVGLSDVQAAELIQEDGVDILVDLVGHTGNNRLLVFARKPAPVQISYLGYPNTTGLSTIDYRLTDAWADPPGDVENLYTEELVRLPGGFLCYHPPSPSPEVAPLPALTSGQVTFGAFNNATKVNPEVIALWSKILKVLPNARLIMKALQLGDVGTRQRFTELFEQNGVSRERVELLGWASSIAKHLELYNRVDIGLDPFPYNGTTTTCEALWMGVPVITLAGHAHAARVGVSLLSSVGCPELIAETPEAYVALAVHWASDLERLKALRNRLREQMRHSPLTDASGFARRVEAAYRTMWRRWCEKPQRMPRNQA